MRSIVVLKKVHENGIYSCTKKYKILLRTRKLDIDDYRWRRGKHGEMQRTIQSQNQGDNFLQVFIVVYISLETYRIL